jgi:hypothetical protein
MRWQYFNETLKSQPCRQGFQNTPMPAQHINIVVLQAGNQ